MNLITDLLTREFTLQMVKPDSYDNWMKIIGQDQGSNFEPLLMKHLRLNIVGARMFYDVHEGKPFFNELTEHIASGPVLAVLLRKYGADAIKELRDLVGNTDPEKAEEGTIRNIYGKSITKNAVHAADSLQRVRIEVPFFWAPYELIGVF